MYFIDPDGMAPIPGGAFVSDTKYLGTSDTSTGGFGGLDVRTFDKDGKTLDSVTVNDNQGVDINADGAITTNGLQTQGDAGGTDVSLGGGSCPDGDCGGKDQTENVGNGISATVNGIDVNSKIHSETYTAKYGTPELSKNDVTKSVRNQMKKTAAVMRIGGFVATGTFGAYDIWQGYKQDGNRWGYNANLAIGKTVVGGFGGYIGGRIGMMAGTGSGGPGGGTIKGAVVGGGAGVYVGSMVGEIIVKWLYKKE